MLAYVAPPGELTDKQLRSYLQQRLPCYMVPAQFVLLEAFPLTANGKLDVRSLPEPTGSPASAERPCRTSVLALWEEILERRGIGPDENFFDLGGTSLQLLRMHAQLERLLGRPLPIADLFQFPTARSLEAHLFVAADADGRARVRRERTALRQVAGDHFRRRRR